MSFPIMAAKSGCGCTGTCSCDSVSQTTLPISSLPNPTTPCNFEGEPAEVYSTDEVVWAGADNDVFGFKNGDKLTKVLNCIIAKIAV